LAKSATVLEGVSSQRGSRPRTLFGIARTAEPRGCGLTQTRKPAVITIGEKMHLATVLVTNESHQNGRENTQAVYAKSQMLDLGYPVLIIDN
jgi:hypothetical protein